MFPFLQQQQQLCVLDIICFTIQNMAKTHDVNMAQQFFVQCVSTYEVTNPCSDAFDLDNELNFFCLD